MIKSKYANALEEIKQPKKKAAKKAEPKKKPEAKVEEKKLTPKQELFCQLYATDRDLFGNGTQAYIEAYNIDLGQKGAYANARNSAYDNLTKPDILKRIDELMELGPLNSQSVDRQLAFLIEQSADTSTKLGAIREFNKLKQRITEKREINHSGNLTYANMSDDELDKKLKDIEEQENKEL